MKSVNALATTMACAVAGLLTVPTLARAQIRIQDHVVMGADAAMRGFQESDFPRTHRLTDNLYVVEDIAGPIDGNGAFTTNAMIVITSEGVVLLDAFKNVESTARLVEIVRNLTEQPVRYLILGADHSDHTAGNRAIIDAYPDVVFVAHPNADIPDDQRARVGRYVADTYTLTLGGVNMEIMFLGRAHTGSDLVTYLPQYDVVWASETWFNGLYPSAGGGLTAYPIEWLDMLHRLDDLGADLVLPNHGFIDSPQVMRRQWREFIALMENLVSGGRALFERGVPIDRAAYSINIGRFQYWYRAANNLHFMLLRLYAELDGSVQPLIVTERTPALSR
jgi:glyoxylase-like metal-dependent hydrolase (beta-lactamase superfamily II)